MDNFNTKAKLEMLLHKIDTEVDDCLFNIAESYLEVEKSLGYEVILKSKDVFCYLILTNYFRK